MPDNARMATKTRDKLKDRVEIRVTFLQPVLSPLFINIVMLKQKLPGNTASEAKGL
jgi:hypothetical protein